MTVHLTETQLAAAITSDDLDPKADSHLASCSLCQHEVNTLLHLLSDFRLAATDFSSVHTPVLSAKRADNPTHFLTLSRTIWATGLAAVLTFAAVTASTLRRATPNEPQAAKLTVTSSVSDEALFEDIEGDLSTSVPPPLQPLDVTASTSEQSSSNYSN